MREVSDVRSTRENVKYSPKVSSKKNLGLSWLDLLLLLLVLMTQRLLMFETHERMRFNLRSAALVQLRMENYMREVANVRNTRENAFHSMSLISSQSHLKF
jgi:hypothetical protein